MSSNTWDELAKRLDAVPKPVQELRLCPDPEVRDRYLTAKKDHEQADNYLKQMGKDADPEALAHVQKEAQAAAEELAAAKSAYDKVTIVLKFKALPRGELEKLQNAHPAGEQDEAKGEDYAFETFAPALISAASMNEMPVDYAAKALDQWAPGDARDLWNAAWSIQHARRTDLGKG
ncbi:hypothetical protein [Streptomyces sp. NPDC058295]|uniref:hypothetical protein n=1 Tax=Streptomyces sp. NPDC058295 TaxID=3346431 RepID=UPI0036E175AF